MDSSTHPPASVRVRPNRNTLGLASLLVAMWYAGASQNNGAAYLLCFVLTGISLVSILHTRANLRGLRMACGAVSPVFAGESLRLRIGVLAVEGGGHAAVRIGQRAGGETIAFSDIAGPYWLHAELPIAAPQRGYFEELTLMAKSLYPLGFFSARMVVTLRQPRWVYPALTGSRPLPGQLAAARNRGGGVRAEGDDFAGLRTYVPGEPQRHVDWKAAARGQGLFIKQWAGEADETLILAWPDTAGLAYEARLSQLARWIATAERGGHAYALDLPGKTIAAGQGDAHFHECLRALALFPAEVPA